MIPGDSYDTMLSIDPNDRPEGELCPVHDIGGTHRCTVCQHEDNNCTCPPERDEVAA